MGRAPCCDKIGLRKGAWTPEEDQKLLAYIQSHGHGSWRALPKQAGLLRCGKSCRLRWTNYLRPDIKRGRFSLEEEQVISHLHAILGNRWSAIATHLPGRTDNEIKNYWNTHLKKRMNMQTGGIRDPAMSTTHSKTSTETLDLVLDSPDMKPLISSKLSHMSQWDSARLEAEVRLSHDSQLKVQDCESLLGRMQGLMCPKIHNSLATHQATSPDCKELLSQRSVQMFQSPEAASSHLLNNCWKPTSFRSHEGVDHISPTSTLCSLEGQHSSPSPAGSETHTGYVKPEHFILKLLLQNSSSSQISHKQSSGLMHGTAINGPNQSPWQQNQSELKVEEMKLLNAASPGSLGLISTEGQQPLSLRSSSSPQPTASVISKSSWDFPSMGIPPELLLDFRDRTNTTCVTQKNSTALGTWSELGGLDGKDYWTNMLQLVGPPCNQPNATVPTVTKW
ncbi:hypothetical protein BDL97_09G091000 [Sphagnum fallax]|nr:hypothetical protein BDL97_09G091000 [Sphagnum fallax]